VTDENKEKIVEAGALPLYVKLLSPERDESVQRAAAKGLWSLAFKCKGRVRSEPGCVKGRYLFTISNIVINCIQDKNTLTDQKDRQKRQEYDIQIMKRHNHEN